MRYFYLSDLFILSTHLVFVHSLDTTVDVSFGSPTATFIHGTYNPISHVPVRLECSKYPDVLGCRLCGEALRLVGVDWPEECHGSGPRGRHHGRSVK